MNNIIELLFYLGILWILACIGDYYFYKTIKSWKDLRKSYKELKEAERKLKEVEK